MPINIELGDDGYILYYTIRDPWTIQDLMEAYQKELQLRDSVDHIVHSIVDFTNTHQIPKNWLQAKQGPGLTHPRAGEMLIVGISPAVKILFDTILRISHFGKGRLKLFSSLSEAQGYILPALPGKEDGQRA